MSDLTIIILFILSVVISLVVGWFLGKKIIKMVEMEMVNTLKRVEKTAKETISDVINEERVKMEEEFKSLCQKWLEEHVELVHVTKVIKKKR